VIWREVLGACRVPRPRRVRKAATECGSAMPEDKLVEIDLLVPGGGAVMGAG